MNQVELFLRVADEFRYYRSAEGDKGKQRFPDVLFIDNLYLSYSDLFDFVDVKIGRQEMTFGAKRIISDGTGGDGSHTSFAHKGRTLPPFHMPLNASQTVPQTSAKMSFT